MLKFYKHRVLLKNPVPTMLYNLRNGKTVELSLERYLRMTDNDFQDLEARDYGEDVNDPFFGSIMAHPDHFIDEIENTPDIVIEEITDEEEPPLDVDPTLLDE